MINYIKKDITTVERGIIGHGCNASGGFGSGVAGAIKKKFPIVHEKYFNQYRAGTVKLGTIHVVNIHDDLYVVNMITQQTYGYDGAKYADLDAIASTLEMVVLLAEGFDLPIYVPKIGCGLGGLDFEKDVQPIYESAITRTVLDNLDVEINVCEL